MDFEQNRSELQGSGTIVGRQAAGQGAAGGRVYLYKDAEFRKQFVQAMLIINLLVWGYAVFSGYQERQFLMNLQQGVFATEQEAGAAAEVSDQRQRMVGFAQIFLFFVTLVFLLMWVHRVNNNCRALTGAALECTPGWAVGWFFVPIACLWKPYQAIREIWSHSAAGIGLPFNWGTGLVGFWWASWVISQVFGQASGRIMLRAEEMDELLRANSIVIVSNAVDMGSFAVTFVLVGQLYALQKQIQPSAPAFNEAVPVQSS